MESLANRFRPKCFAEVVGQKSVTSVLSKQIESGKIKNSYLFAAPHGVGKTSLARVFADTLNNGEGEPIEIDAASNNGVESVRKLIAEAQQTSVDSDYKVIIMDECMPGDVEVLTSDGYKKFEDLDHTEKIAQYTDDGKIEFVEPLEYIERDYAGQMYVWKPKDRHMIHMTPNHVQPYIDKNGNIVEDYIKNIHFKQNMQLILAGKGVGEKEHLSVLDRIAIMSQADGCIQYSTDSYTMWLISLKKDRKINRCVRLLESSGLEFNEIKAHREGYRRFTYKTPKNITKLLKCYFNLTDMSYTYCREFIDEVKQWDGSSWSDTSAYYSSVLKSNVDFVSAVATMGGYCCNQVFTEDNRKATFSDYYRLFMTDKKTKKCTRFADTMSSIDYVGKVYCVKVSSKKIVVRAEGFTFITGNCHMLTNQSWNAMLKTIEEPPLNTVFIFCTTNPEKIPDTIMSRVQRFDLKLVSSSEISDRLQYICNEELHKGFELKAIDRIAFLSQGHLRDAIKYLEKCDDCLSDITLKGVEDVLGLASCELILKYVNSVIDKDVGVALEVLNELDKSLCDKIGLCDSILNCLISYNIYVQTKNIELTEIPKDLESLIKDADRDDLGVLLDKCFECRKLVVNADVVSVLKIFTLSVCRR